MRVGSPVNGLPVPYRPRKTVKGTESVRGGAQSRKRQVRQVADQEYIAAHETRQRDFVDGLSTRSKEALTAYLTTAELNTAQLASEWVRVDLYA